MLVAALSVQVGVHWAFNVSLTANLPGRVSYAKTCMEIRPDSLVWSMASTWPATTTSICADWPARMISSGFVALATASETSAKKRRIGDSASTS